MSFEQLLDDKKIHFSLKYYGLRDLGTGWDIDAFVTNYDFWCEILEMRILEGIGSLDDYSDYLLMLKITKMDEAVPILKHKEHKPLIEHLIDICSSKVKDINNGMLIGYINSSIRTIFEHDGSFRHDLRMITLDYIQQFIQGIQDVVLEFLCKEHGYLIVDRFSGFEKRIENNPSLFVALFPVNNIEEIYEYRLNNVLDIWGYILQKSKSQLKDIVNERITILYDDLVSRIDSIDKNNVVYYERKYNAFLKFLQKNNNPKANYFLEYCKKIDSMFNEYMEENAHHYEYEIPVGEIIKNWRETENWVVSIVSLTHETNVDELGPIAVSRLETVKSHKSPFDFICNTNIPIDKHFTLAYQQALDVTASVAVSIFVGILSDDECIHSYLNLLYKASMYVSERVFIDKDNFNDDLAYLLNMIALLFGNKNSNSVVINSLVYSTSMYACAFAENFLKKYYTSIRKDELYIDCKRTTLGDLLNDTDECMVSILGKNHIKNLAYFFLQNNNGVGQNIRNSLAHWSGISNKQLDLMFASKVIWLMTDIVNTLLIDCIHRQPE